MVLSADIMRLMKQMMGVQIISMTDNAKHTAIGGIGLSSVFFVIYAVYCITGYTGVYHNYITVGLFALWLFMAFVEDNRSFVKAVENKTFIWAALFILYYLITSLFFGDIVNTLEYIAVYIMLFSCVFQYSYYRSRNRISEIRFILFIISAAWIIVAIRAILFYEANPSAARTLASDFYAYGNLAIGGGYAIAFGSALLSVYLFDLCLNKTFKKTRTKIFLLAAVAILFYLLVKTESTLTLIACVLGLAAVVIRKMLLNREGGASAKTVVFAGIIFLALVLILFNLQDIGEWMVRVTADGIDNVILRRINKVGEKLMYMGTGETYENYVDERLSYVYQSIETFFKNPVFGVGWKYGNMFDALEANGVGMHSALCDALAQHGVIGAVPFIMFFVKALRKECRVNCNTYIITMLFMVFVNPFEYFHVYSAMFILIPMIDMLAERSNTSDNN